ncbi:mRNA-decapping enzyme 1B-like isoform X2 [Mizuhopecten yessoensis]|uniref:mRNA-decapping enzyme 1B-like isoform X2 n=1 Tax=Mizuhopecten yessoensis TaxID=6573 RepID=UPI000B45D8B7|nr:mRNA-decapping enzyme 1B-like isoform X2 [Mizuhopecten yessoensis]
MVLHWCTPRSAAPIHGFMILNRLGLKNLIEPISKELEFQQQDPFLLYRNAKAIYGIWFYDKEECTRIGQLMNSFLQQVIDSQKAKSGARNTTSPKADRPIIPALVMGNKNVDIMQLLSKAQHEYDKCKVPGVDPKPFIDNPNASATKASNLIKPKPLKIPGAAMEEEDTDQSQPATTPTATLTLETLFRTASLQQTQQAEMPNIPKTSGFHRSMSVTDAERHMTSQPSSEDNFPPLLRQIMSSSSMVEDIERQQWVDPAGSDLSQLSNVAEDPKISRKAQGGKGEAKRSKPHGGEGKKSPRGGRSDLMDIYQGGGDTQSVDVIQQLLSSGSKATHRQAKSVSPGIKHSAEPDPAQIHLGSDLLTPAALEQMASGIPSLSDVGSASAALPQGSDVLLTPMAFARVPLPGTKASPVPMATLNTTSASDESNLLDRSAGSSSSESITVAALTKEQLHQAMLYLLKNDPNFLNILHEGYLSSLKELSGSRP